MTSTILPKQEIEQPTQVAPQTFERILLRPPRRGKPVDFGTAATIHLPPMPNEKSTMLDVLDLSELIIKLRCEGLSFIIAAGEDVDLKPLVDIEGKTRRKFTATEESINFTSKWNMPMDNWDFNATTIPVESGKAAACDWRRRSPCAKGLVCQAYPVGATSQCARHAYQSQAQSPQSDRR